MKRKVVILGGGISGLTAAYELTATPQLRDQWEVEVVEMGHRWGGRLASSHNPERFGRNEEHGLHVWFGWYDNTFRLAEDVWKNAPMPQDCPWTDVWDGLRPIYHSDHGIDYGEQFAIRRAFFPRNADRPGGGDLPSLDALLAALTDLPRALTWSAASLLAGRELGSPKAGPWKMRSPRKLLALVEEMIRAFPKLEGTSTRARMKFGQQLGQTLETFHRPMVLAGMAITRNDATHRDLVHLLDFAFSAARGICSPEHKILLDGDFDRISKWEMVDWLRYHGMSEASVQGRLLHAVYDIPFAFRNGDPDQRVVEASTALRYTLRILFSYKHAPAYLLNGGAGETLVAPLYALLRDRGVRFTPFHRLESLRLNEDGDQVARIELTQTARTQDYDPLVERHGFLSLRHEPDWTQIEDGETLRDRGVDFYSRFADQGELTPVSYVVGQDFDDVILALPLGSIAGTPDKESPVRAWIDRFPHVQRCLEHLHLVPTVAAQVWLHDRQKQMVDRAVVTWAWPYSVVCDMSPVIEWEDWPVPAPRGCAYLCGAAPLKSHQAPSADSKPKQDDLAFAKAALAEQMNTHGTSLFGDDWQEYKPNKATYVRVNTEPWDLADLPLPGADLVRLEASDSGLHNMALAGSWVRSPVNTTSVEAAVCTGIAAARALGADTHSIFAESLFRHPSPRPYLPDRARVQHAKQKTS